MGFGANPSSIFMQQATTNKTFLGLEKLQQLFMDKWQLLTMEKLTIPMCNKLNWTRLLCGNRALENHCFNCYFISGWKQWTQINGCEMLRRNLWKSSSNKADRLWHVVLNLLLIQFMEFQDPASWGLHHLEFSVDDYRNMLLEDIQLCGNIPLCYLLICQRRAALPCCYHHVLVEETHDCTKTDTVHFLRQCWFVIFNYPKYHKLLTFKFNFLHKLST